MTALKNIPTSTGVVHWFLPSFPALALFTYPLLTLFNQESFWGDPGVGWHIVSGRYMLENNLILKHDIFSFTRPGEYWITYEWLFQCLLACIEKIGGFPLIIVFGALVYSAVPMLILRQMIREKSNIYIAFALFFVTALALLGHAHIRPHIFTYLFFTLLLNRVLAFDRGQLSANQLYLFIPVMVVWANLHGGFAVGLAVSGLAFLTALFQRVILKTQNREKIKIYFLFAGGMTAASLITPFGLELHLSILKLLSMDLIHDWNEFSVPDFNSNAIFILLFQLILLLFFLIHKKSRISLLEYVLLLFFVYESLHSQRHIFLFFILSVPILARELTGQISRSHFLSLRSDKVIESQNSLKSDRIWVPLVAIFFYLLTLFQPGLFKSNLYGRHLTKEAGNFIQGNMELFKRPFNSMSTGGVLVYNFWPEMKIFADDRLDLYGEDFFTDEYNEISKLGEQWEEVLKKYDISSIILSSKQVATLFKASPNWRLIYEDDTNHLFVKEKQGEVKP